MRAGLGRGFEHAGAQALAAHLQQAEARDAAKLDARAVIGEALFQALLDRGVVLALFHVDEIDHDQTGKVAQAQLTGDFIGGFEVGLKRGFFNGALTRRLARVHVDRHQGLGDADDDIAARFQLNGRIEHARQIAFDLIAREQRHGFGIGLHVLGMGRHDHLHEVLGGAVACLALDQNLVDVARIKIADRALDQVAFFIDRRRRDGLQREFADLFPQAEEIFVVALDFRFRPVGTGGADDQPRAFGHFDLGGDFLELLAIRHIGDLAADAAAPTGIGHEYAIAPGERQIGGEGGALVAALFLDHLHQHDLANLDHFLDLVAARARAARGADLVADIVIAHGFDLVVIGGGVVDGAVGFGLILAGAVEIDNLHRANIAREHGIGIVDPCGLRGAGGVGFGGVGI